MEVCRLSLYIGEEGLEFLPVISVEIVKVSYLIFVSCLFSFSFYSSLSNHLFNLVLLVSDLLIILLAGILEISDVLLGLILGLLSHERFAHAVGNGTLVEGLVGLDSHLDLVTNTDKKEAPLGAVDGDLTNELVEALSEKLLTEWADAGLSSLSLLDILIKLLL